MASHPFLFLTHDASFYLNNISLTWTDWLRFNTYEFFYLFLLQVGGNVYLYGMRSEWAMFGKYL